LPISANRNQRQIFSVLAAVTPLGFLAWEIYEGTASQEEFIHFLRHRVQPLLNANNFCVLDNARTHHTHDSRVALETVFTGAYHFGARYSPHLMPIETCFAMIKEYIRDNETAATIRPAHFIDRAFRRFAVGGTKAYTIYNHFRGYFENHRQFVGDFYG